jgi:hypothetical protein
MTRVVVYKNVKRELQQVLKTDSAAAEALLDAIRRLKTSTRGGVRLEQPGWRAYVTAPGHAIIASGIGTSDIRVLTATKLPTMYDTERLRQMAEAAISRDASADIRDVGVPSPAARSKIVTLNESESYRRATPRRSGSRSRVGS